jgi:hypothetical protein
MSERCRKCSAYNRQGKIYSFVYGYLQDSYSYDTKRYSGSKVITTTHSYASYDIRGQHDDFICNSCVIKSLIGGRIGTYGFSIALAGLVGFGLQYVFYSRIPLYIGLALAIGLLITGVVDLVQLLNAANSDDPAKQEKYIKEIRESEAGSRLAIKLDKKDIQLFSDKKVVFFTPSEYAKLKRY